MDSTELVSDHYVMSQTPTTNETPTFSKGGIATIAAIAISAALLLVVFLLATYVPVLGFASLCFGVIVKGAASLVEALMKTEDEDYWRPEVRKSVAQLNVIAVITAFPPLLTVAAEKLYGVLPL